MNNYERRVINEVVSLDNIVWWYRIIDRKGFVINGFINHYPDFVVKTQKGKIVMIETKADFLDGSDSRQKIYLGRKWMFMAGDKYRYFMVFEHKDFNEDGAYTLDDFIPILKNL